MKIAVLGATGASGKQVLLEGLERGHHVTALVRSPGKITEQHDNLTVTKVDIYNEETMTRHLAGQDAVVSCLGYEGANWFTRRRVTKVDIYNEETMTSHLAGQDAVVSCLGYEGANWFNRHRVTFYTDTVQPISRALKAAGVPRFIFMSSWYSKYNRSDPFIINWVFKPVVFGSIVHNIGDMEDWLTGQQGDGLDFTSVRCPQLTNSKASGKSILVTEGQAAEGAGYAICRRDVARFMLDIAASGQYKRTCVSIGVA